MEEEGNASSRRETPQVVRDPQQLVVVHPDQGLVVARLGGHLREALVDPLVRTPRGAVDLRLADEIMEQRPDGPVGEAGVVQRDLVGREGDRAVLDLLRRCGRRSTRGVAILACGPRPSNPHATALGEGRLQRGHEPSGRAPDADAFGPPFDGEGEAVRDHDE